MEAGVWSCQPGSPDPGLRPPVPSLQSRVAQPAQSRREYVSIKGSLAFRGGFTSQLSLMHLGALRALEFDRIVEAVRSFALTPMGGDRLDDLEPSTDPAHVASLLAGTTETKRYLDHNALFPLRASAGLPHILEALAVEGRPLEALRLIALADFLDSVDEARAGIRRAPGSFPSLEAVTADVASFKRETGQVREKIEPSGDVLDSASTELRLIRERLRKQRTRLRGTLESYLRGKETTKYLQEQVVTERNGRYVLVIKTEHRSAIPGVVHGTSASGASLFLEPLSTVEINNDIVALEEQEIEEIRRILLALTDAFRARAPEMLRTVEAATALDVWQARARFSMLVGGVEPALSTDGAFELQAARHPLLMPQVLARLGDDICRLRPFDRFRVVRRPSPETTGAGPADGDPLRVSSPERGAEGPGSCHHQDRAARHLPARHRSQHRRQDGGAENGRTAGDDGPGGAPCAGRRRIEAAGLPLALRRHRRRAVDRRQPEHVLGTNLQHLGDGSRPGGAGPAVAGRGRIGHRPDRRRRARRRHHRPLPAARGDGHRHQPLRRAQDLRVDNRRRGRRGVRLRGGDIRPDLSARVRIGGPEPGAGNCGAARIEPVGGGRRASERQRARGAAGRTPGEDRSRHARPRARAPPRHPRAPDAGSGRGPDAPAGRCASPARGDVPHPFERGARHPGAPGAPRNRRRDCAVEGKNGGDRP